MDKWADRRRRHPRKIDYPRRSHSDVPILSQPFLHRDWSVVSGSMAARNKARRLAHGRAGRQWRCATAGPGQPRCLGSAAHRASAGPTQKERDLISERCCLATTPMTTSSFTPTGWAQGCRTRCLRSAAPPGAAKSPLSTPPPHKTRFGLPLVLFRAHWVESTSDCGRTCLPSKCREKRHEVTMRPRASSVSRRRSGVDGLC
jgi:hypothetical protein